MTENLYRKALDAAQKELDELQAKRAEMDARIARLRETVVSLAYLVNDEGQNESLDVEGIGLTDAVAKVLRLSGMALTPAQIRDELARMGFNIKKYSDSISTITKVLKRLSKKGHVDVSVSGKNERKLYIWSPIQPVWDFHMNTGREAHSAIMGISVGNKQLNTKGLINPFAGKGSVDAVITNPPYQDSFGNPLTEAQAKQREVDIQERIKRKVNTARNEAIVKATKGKK